MSVHTTRPSLLSRVAGADDSAWSEFERIYGELIIRFCRRSGMQLGDAEDIRQVVMIKLYRFLPKFEYDSTKGRFRDYLGSMVRNTISSHFSRHKTSDRPVSICEAHLAVPDVGPSVDVWNDEWTQHHIRRAMSALAKQVDEKSIEVFRAILAGEEIQEIEKRFKTRPDAIRKIKQRMKSRMRELIAAQIQDEEHPPGT